MPGGIGSASQSSGAGGICTISTSDLIGRVDNLMDRVQNLEQVLSLVTGMNLSTSTLAEISQSLGTVTNATLINMLNGWVTDGTFSGVAISTLGWVMSDGNAFPVVVMQDGVLQYGFDTNGNSSGEAAGGLVTDYLLCQLSSTAKQFNNFQLVETNRHGTSLVLTQSQTGSRIIATAPGLYHVDMSLPGLSQTGSGTCTLTARVDVTENDQLQFEDSFTRDAQENIIHKLSFNFVADTLFDDIYFELDINTISTLSFRNITKSQVSVIRLGDA